MTSWRAAGTPESIIIWNAGAGSTGRAGDLRRVLDARPGVELIETASREESIRQVKSACRDGIPRVIAAGGDGTINAVITALIDSNCKGDEPPTLAVLPLGSGNDLARSLKMPLVPEEAIEVCLTGHAAPLDVIELDLGDGEPRFAANMVTAGNTGKYLEVLTDEMKQRWGAFCYLRGAVDLLEELEIFPIHVAVDDAIALKADALNLFFANGRTSGGGMTVCADASPSDGLLDLLVIREGTGLDLASLTVDYLTRDIRESDLVLYRRCKRVRVVCEKPIPLSADGDAAKASEFTVSVRPAAIQAVVGA